MNTVVRNREMLNQIRENGSVSSENPPSTLDASVLATMVDEGVEKAGRIARQADSIEPILDDEASFPRVRKEGDETAYYNFDDLKLALRNDLKDVVVRWAKNDGPLPSLMARNSKKSLQYDGEVVLYLINRHFDRYSTGQRKRLCDEYLTAKNKKAGTFVRVIQALIDNGYGDELRQCRDGLDLSTMIDVVLYGLKKAELDFDSQVEVLRRTIAVMGDTGSLPDQPDPLFERTISRPLNERHEALLSALLNAGFLPTSDFIEEKRESHASWCETVEDAMTQRNASALNLLTE